MPETTAKTATVETKERPDKKKRRKKSLDLYKTMREKYSKDLRKLEYIEFTRDSLSYAVLGFDENGNQKIRLESSDLPPYEAEYLTPCFQLFSKYCLDPGALDLPQSYGDRVTCVRVTFLRRKDSIKVRFVCLRQKSDGKYLKESTLPLWIPNEKNLVSDGIVPDDVNDALENCRLVVLSIVDTDGQSVDRRFDGVLPFAADPKEKPQLPAAVPTKAFATPSDTGKGEPDAEAAEVEALTTPPES